MILVQKSGPLIIAAATAALILFTLLVGVVRVGSFTNDPPANPLHYATMSICCDEYYSVSLLPFYLYVVVRCLEALGHGHRQYARFTLAGRLILSLGSALVAARWIPNVAKHGAIENGDPVGFLWVAIFLPLLLPGIFESVIGLLRMIQQKAQQERNIS